MSFVDKQTASLAKKAGAAFPMLSAQARGILV
jgi:hypothetical protein